MITIVLLRGHAGWITGQTIETQAGAGASAVASGVALSPPESGTAPCECRRIANRRRI